MTPRSTLDVLPAAASRAVDRRRLDVSLPATALQEVTLEAVLRGEPRAVGRAISLIENGANTADNLLALLHSHTGRAYRIGVTGPPGAGKSTLVTRLALQYRAHGLSVGILAVDPTSPFTGGAILGDRIRMQDVALDSGVYIRSMATRGALGGLARAAKDAADVLDAAGMHIVILETVGVGQSELDIAGAADVTVVVLVPEGGDGVQAIKSGLMEIADLFAMNKSDRPGAEQAAATIKAALEFRVTHEPDQWIPLVLRTIASEDGGVAELAAAIERYRAHQARTGAARRRRERQMIERVREIVDSRRHGMFWTEARQAQLRDGVATVLACERSPFTLAEALLAA